MSKTYKSLSNRLENILTSSLSNPSDVKRVMDAWNSHSKEVSAYLTQPVKKLKDPNAPKKPTSNYLLFCSDNRNKVRDANPSLSNKDVTKELGIRWKAISAAEKERYTRLYEQTKSAYSDQMKSYTPPANFESTSSKKRRSDGPKRPHNPFLRFCKVTREQLKKTDPTLKGKDVLRRMAEMWNVLPENQKTVYVEAYQNEMSVLNSQSSVAPSVSSVAPSKPVVSAPVVATPAPVATPVSNTPVSNTPAKGKGGKKLSTVTETPVKAPVGRGKKTAPPPPESEDEPDSESESEEEPVVPVRATKRR